MPKFRLGWRRKGKDKAKKPAAKYKKKEEASAGSKQRAFNLREERTKADPRSVHPKYRKAHKHDSKISLGPAPQIQDSARFSMSFGERKQSSGSKAIHLQPADGSRLSLPRTERGSEVLSTASTPPSIGVATRDSLPVATGSGVHSSQTYASATASGSRVSLGSDPDYDALFELYEAKRREYAAYALAIDKWAEQWTATFRQLPRQTEEELGAFKAGIDRLEQSLEATWNRAKRLKRAYSELKAERVASDSQRQPLLDCATPSAQKMMNLVRKHFFIRPLGFTFSRRKKADGSGEELVVDSVIAESQASLMKLQSGWLIHAIAEVTDVDSVEQLLNDESADTLVIVFNVPF